MVTAIALALVTSCAPARHVPPPITAGCEGSDYVRRDHDRRVVSRVVNAPACLRTACEGADQVRRDFSGRELSRWTMSPSCLTVRCEGFDFVRRDVNGFEVERRVSVPRCGAPVPVPLVQEPWRYGLTSRG